MHGQVWRSGSVVAFSIKYRGDACSCYVPDAIPVDGVLASCFSSENACDSLWGGCLKLREDGSPGRCFDAREWGREG